MKHTSIKLDSPVEFINITPLNPLISKCQIKVCYVGDEPNRNQSVITKDTAKELANSIPGCPIVGFYNESTQDFEEHNRIIDISNGQFEIKDTTKPYGFVDMNAKVWFQKFIDDGEVEHEYLMTEGYLWTGQYPECQRVIDKGNNQSMELDEETLNATWSKGDNGKPDFFIINEAIMSKLCILGEDCEPCFEGSQITKVQFSFEDGFKQQLFSMMQELKEVLNEGGAKLFNRYAVEIGDKLWCSLYDYLCSTYPNTYLIDGVYEEDNQKFAVLKNRQEEKYYRLNFSLSEAEEFSPEEGLIEVTTSYTVSDEPQFAEADVEAFENEYNKKDEEEDKEDKEDNSNSEDNKEDENGNSADDEEDGDDNKEDKDEKNQYSLEEYEALKSEFSALQTSYNDLKAEKEALDAELTELREFKAANEETAEELAELRAFRLKIDKQDKQKMIDSFYMLSNEDKKDVIENIDKYSVNEIEEKLSVICVRNKVSFDQEDNHEESGPHIFNLDDSGEDTTPAWVKAVLKAQNND